MALAERISEWVRKHHFERVALQFPDALLGEAPEILEQVCEKLKDRRVFILGDSSFGGGGVDEVGARHYGADCIVRFGHAEQQRGGDLPVLFVFDEQIAADCVEDAEEIVKRVHGLFAKRARVEGDDMDAHLLVLCDLPQQYMAEPLGQALVESFGKFLSSHPSEARWQVLVATPHQEAFSGDIPTGWRDWRFGALQLGQAWWSTLGTLTLAGAARPPRLKVCGRDVYALGSGADTQPSMGRTLPPNSAVLYVGPKGSSLERCALLRYGASCPVWSLERLEAESPHVGARLERIFSHALLQKRYRFVELAKAAGTIGLLMVSAGGPTTLGKALAERLEALLSKANRQSYRLVVGQPTQEKLGNFPEIECYVLLSGPEQFMWDLRDFMVPICTPFELEVALGAREWTGEYLTDLQELLDTAPMTEVLPNTVSEDATLVQSLGTKIRSFESNGPLLRPKSTVTETSTVTEMKAPASITPGLYGVPWKYSQEGLSRSEVDN
ncbi:unnamed protein product [Durusdinium trenchii]|uniref:Uncharacterized protein n=2 Tax=Durusdinium trenchii TaxID=1381693 RepID=A0ABP0QSA7_9DINO